MGQLTTELRNRPQGALPSDTENPRNLGKEHCKVVALRSGKTLEPKEAIIDDEPIEKEESQPTVEIPTPDEPEPTKSNKKKLPPKLKDPRSFTIPCNIGEPYCGKALCDLGASINLMPKSIFKLLGIDFEVDMEVSIILGRPFLAMGRTLINIQKGELTMRVQDDQVTFNVLRVIKFLDPMKECSVTLVSME
ncbi:uncharacterized protein LOC105801129 [Gossypium raimondii]|uniref:uncharacterized protein LOC105801129 n=1 Tax=Gossypium raimondii TaxID=29730 RepID=UPI00227CF2FB|nr:uncharacterized protein LOC105801129 [Gossypium raimondii]